jgi:hypothetical protein
MLRYYITGINLTVGEQTECRQEQPHVKRNRDEVTGESTDGTEIGSGGGAG